MVNGAVKQQEQTNKQLRRVLTSLRNDMDMVEYIARYELWMVGENEVLFELLPTASNSKE